MRAVVDPASNLQPLHFTVTKIDEMRVAHSPNVGKYEKSGCCLK